MQQLIIKLKKFLNGLSQRDQVALVITGFAVIIMIWSNLVYLPLSEDKKVIERDIAQKMSEIDVLQSKMIALQKINNTDPDVENRRQLDKYKEEGKRLNAAFVSTSVQFINPQEMASLLEQMLQSHKGLKFVSLENRPAVPEFVDSHAETDVVVDNVHTIYRHGVILQMEGSYHDALSYLKKLEELPWRFFWQSIDIESSGYPNTLITLEVYTLGFREGLIGA